MVELAVGLVAFWIIVGLGLPILILVFTLVLLPLWAPVYGLWYWFTAGDAAPYTTWAERQALAYARTLDASTLDVGPGVPGGGAA